jgi:hypothetical protein
MLRSNIYDMSHTYQNRATNHILRMFVNDGFIFALYAMFHWYGNNHKISAVNWNKMQPVNKNKQVTPIP